MGNEEADSQQQKGERAMKTTITTLAAIMVMAIGVSQQAQAADTYWWWDADGAGGANSGGTGPWNFVDQTWHYGDYRNPATNWVDGNVAKFWNASATLTLQTNIGVSGLSGDGAFTIGGPFNLTFTGMSDVNPGTGTITCPVILKGGNIQWPQAWQAQSQQQQPAPMPVDAPVISATLPSKRPVGSWPDS